MFRMWYWYLLYYNMHWIGWFGCWWHQSCTRTSHSKAHGHAGNIWELCSLFEQCWHVYMSMILLHKYLYCLLQVELALDVESIVPHFIRRKFVVKLQKIRPHEHLNPIQRFLSSKSMSSEAITKALNPELVSIYICN